MNPVNILISVIKAIGLLIVAALVNIPLFWSFSGFIRKLTDFLGL
jgi:uncharacterized membrane protein YqhA